MGEPGQIVSRDDGKSKPLHRRRVALALTGLAIFLIVFGACYVAIYRQATGDIEAIRPTIDEFHRRYQAGEYGAIYDASDPRLQQGLSKDEALRRLDQMRTRLGDVVKVAHECTVRAGQLKIIRTEYHVAFANVEAWETYDWQDGDNAPRLLAYAVETGFETGTPDWELALAPGKVRPQDRTCMDDHLPYDFWWDPIQR